MLRFNGDFQRPSLGNHPGLHGRARRFCYGKRSGRGESHERVPSLRGDAAIEADGQRNGGEQRRYHVLRGRVSREEKKMCGVSAAMSNEAGAWVIPAALTTVDTCALPSLLFRESGAMAGIDTRCTSKLCPAEALGEIVLETWPRSQ